MGVLRSAWTNAQALAFLLLLAFGTFGAVWLEAAFIAWLVTRG